MYHRINCKIWNCKTVLVSVSLSPMMPLARKAYVHLPGAFSEPHRHFPFQSPCCSWTGPCGSYSCKRPSAIPTMELLKQAKCVTHGSWFYIQRTVWEHSRVMVGRERERERERERMLQCRPRVSFLLGLRVGVWAEFCVFVTIWQVKLKKENTNGSVI